MGWWWQGQTNKPNTGKTKTNLSLFSSSERNEDQSNDEEGGFHSNNERLARSNLGETAIFGPLGPPPSQFVGAYLPERAINSTCRHSIASFFPGSSSFSFFSFSVCEIG
jgi:hypothetical protein